MLGILENVKKKAMKLNNDLGKTEKLLELSIGKPLIISLLFGFLKLLLLILCNMQPRQMHEKQEGTLGRLHTSDFILRSNATKHPSEVHSTFCRKASYRSVIQLTPAAQRSH